MKMYIKPSIEVTVFDSESIMKVSSVNTDKIKPATDNINTITWHGQM